MRMSEQAPGPVNSDATDIGDFLHVDENQRLTEDDFVADEVNEDEHVYDLSHVPDGEVVELSTADLDDPSQDEVVHEQED